jgi:hypothetical protein
MNAELKRRIDEVALECNAAGWDGYGAKAVTVAAVAHACAFADALDSGLPAPEVGAEPDGVLTFEWYRSTRQTLSVSVHADGILHYAALFGPERICGTEVFQARMPQVLNELITRIEQRAAESF